MKEQLQLTIQNEKGRLDKVLSQCFPNFSRTQIQDFIEKGQVMVNGQSTINKYKVTCGDRIQINVPEPVAIEVKPENIPLDILYEDEDIAIVNKPKGMVVHPGAGNPNGTLVNALLYHIKDLSGINGEIRPGIVHRLDKDTSGGLVIAKNDITHQKLSEQLEKRTMKREYIALVHGHIPHKEGRIDAPIGRDPQDRKKFIVRQEGKEAITNFSVLKYFAHYTLVRAQLETGRTHQIRVHFKYIGYPIVGDNDYGRKNTLTTEGQLLHAQKLGFIHPRTGEYMEYVAPLPSVFQDILDQLQ
ncbi:RluA family pseudouridine synthase [Allofustis seminis]|uniref:RluA family pseudouridine synthase n=1 Tax=Allofustis seminis TaxID=166939 RepID=UPI00035DCB69|nr:RluA family pseudouridine synthase [Allofustis seminis]